MYYTQAQKQLIFSQVPPFHFQYRPYSGSYLYSSLPRLTVPALPVSVEDDCYYEEDVCNLLLQDDSHLMDFLVPQGQSSSTINNYGNGNTTDVRSDVGANGWTSQIPINVAEGPVTASSDMGSGIPGGSSTSKPSNPSGSSSVDKKNSKVTVAPAPRTYHKWWEPAAAKALERGVDRGLDIADKGVTAVGGLIGKKVSGTIRDNPSNTLSQGNSDIQTQAAIMPVTAYAETSCVPLPTPDLPATPGPAADRQWLMDTFPWTPEVAFAGVVASQNTYGLPPYQDIPALAGSVYPGVYPLPHSFLHLVPDTVYARNYSNHSYFNCGWQITLTCNPSQFHAGAVVLFAIPEGGSLRTQLGSVPYTNFENPESVFVYPFEILNLTTTNRVTLNLPYIAPTPLDVTSFVHAPWVVCIMCLSPLQCPSSAPQQLTMQLFCSPVNSTFHGLRSETLLAPFVEAQHLKFRSVPAAAAFGNVIAGQEMPLTGTSTAAPPLDYLPGEVKDWIEFAQRPGLLQSLTWTMADDPAENLLTLPVSPTSMLSAAAPIATLFNIFGQWRGSINIELLFTGSSQHYGRLAVCYTPFSNTVPKTMNEAMQGTYTVWDITGASTLTFTIPFISHTYWRTTAVDTAAIPSSATSFGGWFSIWVINPLTAPNTAPPAALVQLFVSAGDDFNVRLLHNPIYEFQAGDLPGVEQTTSGFETLETGSSDNTPQPREGFEYAGFPRSIESRLDYFFSIYRRFSTDLVQIKSGSSSVVSIVPLSWNAETFLGDTGPWGGVYPDKLRSGSMPLGNQLISLFAYIHGDLRIGVRFTNNSEYRADVTVSYLPPGIPLAQNPTLPNLMNNYMVSVPVAPLGNTDSAFSIPYNSPLSAIPLCYNGFKYGSVPASGQTKNPTWGNCDGASWGTLVFWVAPQNTTTTPPDIEIFADVFFSFTNFRAFCPLPTYRIKPPPTSAVAVASQMNGNVYYRRLARKTKRYAHASELVYQNSTGNADFCCDNLYSSRVCIVRRKTCQYVHWAVRCTTEEGVSYQISLSRKGLKSLVAWEEPLGDEYQEINPQIFLKAVALIGSDYPYSVLTNCTSFISDLTGVSLPNTGTSLATGLLLAGAGSLGALGYFSAQTQEGLVPQGLFDSKDSAKSSPPSTIRAMAAAATSLSEVVTPETVTRVLDLGDRSVDVAAAAALRLENASNNIRESINQDSFQPLADAASDIRQAAETMSASLDGMRRVVEDLQKLFTTTKSPKDLLTHSIQNFLHWVAKLIGYIIIIFGSPTPLTIAGVLLCISAEILPNIDWKRNPIAALFSWIAVKLGINHGAEEVIGVVGADEVDSVPGRQSGVKDFNNGMTAMRHTDWLLARITTLARKLFDWLTDKAQNSPEALIHQSHEKIVELYSDSIKAISSDKIDSTAVKQNLDLAARLLKISNQAKTATHSTMLTQAIRNYNQALNTDEKNPKKQRPEPVVIYLSGPAGSGKSVLATLLASILAKHFSGDSNDVYSPSSQDCQFYDGYTGQSVHLIDDIGQDPDGKDWQDIPNLVSTAPFIVPMAAIERKGCHYTSKVILMTSNFAAPNNRSVRSMAALERRLHFRLSVRPSGDETFLSVAEALSPCGPATKYFAKDFPLARLESNRVEVCASAIPLAPFDHLDGLIDQILFEVARRENANSLFASLIPQSGGEEISSEDLDDPMFKYIMDGHNPVDFPRTETSSSIVNENVQSSVPPKVHEAIKTNKPVGFLADLWAYRKPILFCASFFTVMMAISKIFSLAWELFSNRILGDKTTQGAYSALAKPKAKPRTKGTPAPKGLVYQGLSSAYSTIMANLVPLSADDGSGCWENHVAGFFLYSRYMVTVSHFLSVESKGYGKEVLNTPVKRIKIGSSIFNLADLPPPLIYEELCVLQIPGREYKDMRRFVREDSFPTGHVLGLHDGKPVIVRAWEARERSVFSPTSCLKHEDAIFYRASTFRGLCGGVFVTDNPSGISLLGVHFAGVCGHSGFSGKVQPLLSLITDHFSQSQSLIKEISSTHSVHLSRKTRLQHSPAWGAFPSTVGPSVLSTYDERLQVLETLDTVVMSKHGQGDIVEPWQNLEAAFDLYFSVFPKSIRTLTMSEAINGTSTLDGIDMNQSPGIPWVGKGIKRKALFEQSDDFWIPKPELVQEVEKCLSHPDYWYATFLKDELRPLDKVSQGKTRLIEAAPIHAIIAGRMLFGGLFEMMQAQPGRFGSAVGCNPDTFWTELFQNFSSYDFVYDMDYKAFDSTLPTCTFNLLSKHLQSRIKHPSVTSYLLSISSSKHVFGSTAFEMVGGNPSGCVGTSIFNSIINNCCLLSALMSDVNFDPSSFYIVSYGDDLLYAHEPPISPNMVKDFYQKYTPLKVTRADKRDEPFDETSTIWDVSFLRRSFVPDPKHSVYIHPVIDPEVYQQSVMWQRDGDWQDVVTSLSYLAFHAGPLNYQGWCDAVRNQAQQNGQEVTFLPFSYLQNRWLMLLSA